MRSIRAQPDLRSIRTARYSPSKPGVPVQCSGAPLIDFVRPEARTDLFVHGRDSLAARRHFALEQKGSCAICHRSRVRLVLDHEHSDIELCRGLLCDNCNRALGCFSDSRPVLAAAIDYLKRHDERNAAYIQTDDYAARTVKVYTVKLDAMGRGQRNRRIRAEFDEGKSIQELCELFKLGKSSVYEIVYGDEAAA